MIAEILVVLALLAGGSLLLRTAGLRGFGLPALGFVAGIGLYLGVGLVLALTRVTTRPLVALVLAVVLPLVWWSVRRRGGGDLSVHPGWAALCAAMVVVVVLLTGAVDLMAYHWDSLEHAALGAMLADGRLALEDTILLQLRGLGVALLLAPARATGAWYLPSLMPLLGIAVLVSLAWFVREGTARHLTAGSTALVATGAVAVVASTNRFVFHSFYLNGHLLVASLLLSIAAAGWLLEQPERPDRRAIQLLQLIALPALVIARPDGWLLAAVALLPSLTSPRIERRHRSLLAVALGGSVLAWHGLLATEAVRETGQVPLRITLLLVVGALLLLGATVLARVGGRPWARWLVPTAEVAIWIALLGAVAAAPALMRDSVRASAHNLVLGAGSWGASLVVLAGLVVGALVLTRTGARVHLRLPVTAFLPLMLLLSFARSGAYRVHQADSLNRMMIHIVPLAVLYVATAAVAARRSVPPRRRRLALEDAAS